MTDDDDFHPIFWWLTFILIVNRQFYCNQSRSTFSISYQYVYCIADLTNDFISELTITVDNSSEIYTWYEDDYSLSNLPADASLYGGSSFSNESDSNLFRCLDTTSSNNLDEITGSGYNSYNVNAITVSYEYSSKVNSNDSILVQISNYLDNHNYWFMIGDVEIRCLSMFLTLSLLR